MIVRGIDFLTNDDFMKMLERYLIFWIRAVLLVTLILYITSLQDEVYIIKYREGLWYKDIINLSYYFIEWVLPHFWLLIILGGAILGYLMFLASKVLSEFRSSKHLIKH